MGKYIDAQIAMEQKSYGIEDLEKLCAQKIKHR